jgi:DNA topoisomerase IA
VDRDFEPKYRVPNEKKEVVKELKRLAGQVEEVFLATDPDREGEAISWHLLEAAQIEKERAHRVVFHEITEPAINEAFAHPRGINMDLVNAQQARRVSTDWLAIASARSCGRRCAAGCPLGAFNPLRSGSSSSGNVKLMPLCRLNIGRSQRNLNRKEFDPHS